MNTLGVTVVLGLLIEDIKVYTKPDGDNTYKLEIELLETDCHVLDPTPLANCTVRPKRMTAVEGDCDVLLKRVGGVMTVTAFKCKTEESTEDLCLGCHTLLPLNDTTALDFVHTSLATFNNMTDVTYAVMEVGRMSSQVVSGGLKLTALMTPCVPLNDAMAARGFCTTRGSSIAHIVDCKMFLTMMPIIDANRTVADANSTVAADTNSTAAADTKSTAAADTKALQLQIPKALQLQIPKALQLQIPTALQLHLLPCHRWSTYTQAACHPSLV
ncbi:hypothetical protein KUCAC02_018038 [Chaenocephalus aceratus]|uniref:Uncharacterized protein n=1 Tax=Chaenocephalus aceratus TaxID=36190 RepID=A0ACB9W7B2_CHAAC|nr:hypothetical protein KUCAC02_018038 [Chaenocephalus aceratus]